MIVVDFLVFFFFLLRLVHWFIGAFVFNRGISRAKDQCTKRQSRRRSSGGNATRAQCSVHTWFGLVRDMVSLPPITIAPMYLLNCLKRFIVRVFHAPLFNSL